MHYLIIVLLEISWPFHMNTGMNIEIYIQIALLAIKTGGAVSCGGQYL